MNIGEVIGEVEKLLFIMMKSERSQKKLPEFAA